MGRFGAETVKPTILVGTVPFLGSLSCKAPIPKQAVGANHFSRCICVGRAALQPHANSLAWQVTGRLRKVLQSHAKTRDVVRACTDKGGRRRVCGGAGLKRTQRYPIG